jgi:hypothetical protein
MMELEKTFMIKLSVILPCFNGAETITAQLEALANQQWSEPWDVIVGESRVWLRTLLTSALPRTLPSTFSARKEIWRDETTNSLSLQPKI